MAPAFNFEGIFRALSYGRGETFRGGATVAQLAVKGSFLEKSKNVNEENCWKPELEIVGNQQPSPALSLKELERFRDYPKGVVCSKQTKHLASHPSILTKDDDIVHPLWKHWDKV